MRDLVRHFIQYWNFAKDEVDSNQKAKNILAHKKTKSILINEEISLKSKMKAVNIAFKYKLMPTKFQHEIFSSWAGTCRFLFNLC